MCIDNGLFTSLLFKLIVIIATTTKSFKIRNKWFRDLKHEIGIMCIDIAAELIEITKTERGRQFIANSTDYVSLKSVLSTTLMYSKYYTHRIERSKLNKLCNALSQYLPDKIDEFHVQIPPTPPQHSNEYFSFKLKLWAAKYLQNYSRNDFENQSSNKECTEHHKCLCFQRIIYIMDVVSNYNEIKMNDKKQNDMITKENIFYIMSSGNYSTTQFQNDFYHIVSNHLSKNEKSWNYAQASLINAWCSYNKNCFIFQRHRRMSKYDKNKNLRMKIYDNLFKSKEVVIFHLIDTVHHYLMHSKMKSRLFSVKHSKLIRKNEEKRKNVLGFNLKFKIDETDRTNRYITDSNIIKQNIFSFGFQFFHHSYYNKRKTYINKPKYKNLKDELFNNKWYKIENFEWYDTLERAIINYYTITGKELNSATTGDANFIQSMPSDIRITVAHLFVILFYTNYTPPQRAFKQNCFGYNDNDSLEIIKESHKEITNYYRLLHEVILFYGEEPNENDVFYHGLNKCLYFNEFHCTFNAPISTTKLHGAAITFCDGDGDGMLLSLKPDNSVFDRYFDCWCSAHPEEREALFCIAHHLYIFDIMLQKFNFKDLGFTQYVVAMTILQHILNGTYFSCLIPTFTKYESTLIQLIEIYNNDDNMNYSVIPDYIKRSFELRYIEYKKHKIINVITSEFNLLESKTQSVIKTHFNINLLPEFTWNIDKNQLKNALKREDNFIQSLEKYRYENKQHDIGLNFHFYIRPNIIGPFLYKTSKLSVGILLDNEIMDSSFLQIQWGFKCKEMNYCLPKSVATFKKYVNSDAFKTFSNIDLDTGLVKELCFTFYIKYLNHENDPM